MAERALVIGLGWEQQRLLDVLMGEGLDLIGVHSSDPPPHVAFVSLNRVDLRDLESILRIASHERIDAVIADQDDYAHFAASLVAATRRLPGASLDAAQIGSNKHASRVRSQARGLPVPDFALCLTPDEALRAARRLGLPVIVKPVDNRGSIGISVVRELPAVPGAAIEAIVHSHSHMILVEQLVAGTNMIAEGYVFADGHETLAIGRKTTIADRPHVHRDIRWSAASDPLNRHIVELNDRVVDELGFDFGMTSAEYVLDEDGSLWLIEIANRGGGVQISSHVVPCVSGVDTTRLLVLDALGRRTAMPTAEGVAGRSAFLGYFAFPPGQLVRVDGVEEAQELPGVLTFRYWGAREGKIDWPRNALERQGVFVTVGQNAAEAESRAENVYETVVPRYGA